MRRMLVAVGFAGIVGIAALVTGVSNASAAEVNTMKGEESLVFQFQGLDDLSLGTYKGGVGARFFISDRTALRPMILFGMNTETDEPIDEGDAEIEESSTEFGADLTFEKHLNPVGPVSPYLGLQAGFSMVNQSLDVDGETQSEDDQTNFGLGVVGGFLWGFAEGISLGGEYVVGVSSGTSERKVAGVKVSDGSRTTVGIGTASFFLSVAM